MSVQALGVKTVGAVNVGASLALGQLSAAQVGAGVKLAELQARLAAALKPPTPLDPTAALQAVASFAVGYNPALILQQVAEQIPALSAEVGTQEVLVKAVVEVIEKLTAPLRAGGIHAYKYTGPASRLGQEIGAEVTGDVSGEVQALVFVTSDPASFAALVATTTGAP